MSNTAEMRFRVRSCHGFRQDTVGQVNADPRRAERSGFDFRTAERNRTIALNGSTQLQ
jgi:hypothetical protein